MVEAEMKKKRKRQAKANGRNGRRAVNDRESIKRARGRVLRRALKKGTITNEEARRAMRLHQVWYHLHKLAQAGMLKRTGYDTWEPVRRRGRPVYNNI